MKIPELPGQVGEILKKVTGKHEPTSTELTAEEQTLLNFADVMESYGCVDTVLGVNYEVRDPKGKLLCTIRRKPADIGQFNVLIKYLHLLRQKRKEEGEKQAKLAKDKQRHRK